MKAGKKWQKQLAAAVLGAIVAGMPLFAAEAGEQATFSREGERYDVRRGQYEKEGGSDEHVRLGKYADEEHQEARREEQREDLEKRHAEEREKMEARHAEERESFEKGERKDRGERPDGHKDQRHDGPRDDHRGPRHDGPQDEHRDHRPDEHRDGQGEQDQNDKPREYRYDVRRGQYEQEGGSDIEVRRGQYEQPSEDGQRRGLIR